MTFRDISRRITGKKPPLRTLAPSRVVDPVLGLELDSQSGLVPEEPIPDNLPRRVAGYRFDGKHLPDPTRPLRSDGERRGRRYGKLLVVDSLGGGANGSRWWGCRCDCGGLVARRTASLEAGKAKNCNDCSPSNAERRRLPGTLGRQNSIFNGYWRGAERRGLCFEITQAELISVCSQACTYCGAPAEPFNGADRVDNSVGYVLDNLAPCCGICNRAKNSLSLAAWEAWIDRLTAFRLRHGSAGFRPAPRLIGGAA